MSTQNGAGNPNWKNSDRQRELVNRRWARERQEKTEKEHLTAEEKQPFRSHIGDGERPMYTDGSPSRDL